MLFKEIMMAFLCVFFVIGVVDHIMGNRFGAGGSFVHAFNLAGRVILSITGMICLSPVLAALIEPVVTPLFAAVGLDPGVFAPLFLAPDAGGYSIAMQMAHDPLVGAWAGTVIGAHIGGNISSSIPVSLSIIPRKYHRNYSIGALSGIIASTFGCLAGGLVSGISFRDTLFNLIPLIILSLAIVLSLIFIPDIILRGFVYFGRALIVLILFGLTMATIERLTGFAVLPGMRPFAEGVTIAGTVVLTMGGIMTFTTLIVRVLKKPLHIMNVKCGLNDTATLGIFNALASILPGCADFAKMNPRGQVLFGAFVLSAANVLGPHLGFVGVYVPEMMAPLFVSKLVSGVLAIPVTLIFIRRLHPDDIMETE